MTSNTKDFYGKEVTDAIKKACDRLQVPQEQLEIEVVETGSTGIFGLIRKKAHIRVRVKKSEGRGKQQAKTAPAKQQADPAPDKSKKAEHPSVPEAKGDVQEEKPAVPPVRPSADTDGEEVAEAEKRSRAAVEHENTRSPRKKKGRSQQEYLENGDEDDDQEPAQGSSQNDDQENIELSETTLALVREELGRLLELMGYPSAIEVRASGTSVFCQVGDEHEEVLTGQDGKTLDSLQYLLRKIVARKVPERLRLSVDVGNYRQQRLDDLKEQALDMAGKVREDGKTQVIAALSPSERRVIHMCLQEDKEIRSRSVGDGLFKKILIYKPGKGGGKGGGGRKRGNSRGRKGGSSRKKNDGSS